MPRGYYPRPIRICSIEGCDRRARARGWCTMHYGRWEAHGDPLFTKISPWGTGLAWLEDAIANRDRSECWEWPFGYMREYGAIWFQGRGTKAHIVALILDGNPRPDPPNHHTLHSCDNPPCVNPDHLRWGTRQDNSADKVAKHRHPYGETAPRAKLTEEMVRAIRADPRPNYIVAMDYPVARNTICAIRKRRSWKHLE